MPEGCLIGMLDDGEIGPRTYNHYIQAIDSFCNWCVEHGRIIVSRIVSSYMHSRTPPRIPRIWLFC